MMFENADCFCYSFTYVVPVFISKYVVVFRVHSAGIEQHLAEKNLCASVATPHHHHQQHYFQPGN